MKFLTLIKEIERIAYPEALWAFQGIFSEDALVDYCGAKSWSDLLILSGPHWYFIAVISTGEIVDLASKGPLDYKDLVRMKYYIQVVFKGRQIHFDALDNTSYRFTRRFKKIGEILEDAPITKNGLPFHRVVIQIKEAYASE